MYFGVLDVLLFIGFHEISKEIVIYRLLLCRDNLKERINVFICISIIVSLYLSANCDSIRFEKLEEVIFDGIGKTLLKVRFMFGVISYILANWDAKLFDEGEISDESMELNLWVIGAEWFVGFLEGRTSGELLLFSLLFVEFSLGDV